MSATVKLAEGYAEVAQFAIPIAAGLPAAYNEGTTTLITILAGVALQKGTVHVIKKSFPKERPNKQSKKDSLPSGHTTAAAFGAAYAMTKYGVTPLTSAACAGAAAVAASRCYTNHHWLTDVAIGSLVGATIGVLTANNFFTG